jgi:hypothetical protein
VPIAALWVPILAVPAFTVWEPPLAAAALAAAAAFAAASAFFRCSSLALAAASARAFAAASARAFASSYSAARVTHIWGHTYGTAGRNVEVQSRKVLKCKAVTSMLKCKAVKADPMNISPAMQAECTATHWHPAAAVSSAEETPHTCYTNVITRGVLTWDPPQPSALPLSDVLMMAVLGPYV